MIVDTWHADSWKGDYGGPKAKRDIHEVLARTATHFDSRGSTDDWQRLSESADIAISVVQHPTDGLTSPCKTTGLDRLGDFLIHWRRRWQQRVLILHDLKSLQAAAFPHGRSLLEAARWWENENALICAATTIVVHSAAMAVVVREIFPTASGNVVPIGLFDYLCKPAIIPRSMSRPRNFRIMYCGNVAGSTVLAELLEQLPRVTGHSYTICAANLEHGSSSRSDVAIVPNGPADTLPSRLTGRFHAGLCWWARSVHDSGYLRLIAPHKASCYLASGLPLIAPEDSYIGNVVRRRGIGVTVSTLDEIPDRLACLSDDDWLAMTSECVRASAEVRGGLFTRAAMAVAG